MNPVFSPQSRTLPAAARLAALLVFVTTSVAQSGKATPIANFVDTAEKAGLTMTQVFGGKDTKKYIIETTGNRRGDFRLRQRWLARHFPGERHHARRISGRNGAHQSSVSQPARRNFCRRDRQGGADRERLGPGRLRGRLRQRWMGRPLRHLLRKEPALSQSEWSLHRSGRAVRRCRDRKSLGDGMRFRRLRSRRPPRLDGGELCGLRSVHRPCAGRESVVRVEGGAGDVRPARPARRQKYSLPQPGQRQI